MPKKSGGADSFFPAHDNNTDHDDSTEEPRRTKNFRSSLVVSFVAAAVVIALCFAVWNSFPVSNLLRPDRCTATAKGESYVLAPDQTQNAALMTRIAQQRGMPARAATIAIATGFQESKLRNIDYGDRDSLGLFQQRPSQGWGTEKQIMEPVYSINKFYDGLAKIKGYETMEITKAAQKVQRSGFPEAYADHEPEGRAYASALSGYSPRAMTCRLKPLPAAQLQDPNKSADMVNNGMTSAFDVTPTVTGSSITIPLEAADLSGSPKMGWAMAHYALAHAQTWQIASITVDGYRWTRKDSQDGWVKAAESGSTDQRTMSISVVES